MEAITISVIFIATLTALACDAKENDTHALSVRRLYRKIRKVQKVNEQTELDNMFYANQVGK